MEFASLPSMMCSPFMRMWKWAYLPIVKDFNGLGNRVKGLANFYVRGSRVLILVWNTRGWVTASFRDLFSLEGVRIVEFNNGFFYRVVSKLFRRFMPVGIVDEIHPYWSFILPERLCHEKYLYRWSFAKKDSYSIDFRFNEIECDIRDYYRTFFCHLKPSKAVQARIKTFNHDFQTLVAVQVRNSGLRSDRKDVCSIQTIMDAMDSYGEDQRFFMSAMNGEIEKVFRDRYGERVLTIVNKDYSSMVDAVADMWILGRCKELIASPTSTFSEVAWWWGGANVPVKMLPIEYNQRNL